MAIIVCSGLRMWSTLKRLGCGEACTAAAASVCRDGISNEDVSWSRSSMRDATVVAMEMRRILSGRLP